MSPLGTVAGGGGTASGVLGVLILWTLFSSGGIGARIGGALAG